MIELLLALQLSIGVGYNFETETPHFNTGGMGIIQLEQKVTKDWSIGFWHSSRLDNGFKGSIGDKNILYVKRDFKVW